MLKELHLERSLNVIEKKKSIVEIVFLCYKETKWCQLPSSK